MSEWRMILLKVPPFTIVISTFNKTNISTF